MNILKLNNKEYILKYNFRALAEIQERGIKFGADHEFYFKDIVALLHIGLKKFHPELTFDQVFDLMDDILEQMDLEELMVLINKSLEASLGKNNPNPKK